MSARLVALVKRPPLTAQQQLDHAKLWHRFAAPTTQPMARPMLSAALQQVSSTVEILSHVHDYTPVTGYRAHVCIGCGAMLRVVEP